MSIKLKGSSDGSVSFDAPADTSPSGSDITLTLPTSAGSANQFLKNSGIAGELEYSSMVETSAGRIGIGTASPDALLDVENSSGASEIQIKSLNASDCTLAFGDNADTDVGRIRYAHSADAMLFFTAANERCRVDSSGRLLVGTNTDSAPNSWGLGIQVAGTGTNAGVSIRRDSNNSGGAILMMSKSRGSLNGTTIVQENDQVGGIYFQAADGTDLNTTAALIAAEIDGTPGGNDMPTRLIFKTTRNTTDTALNRMTINHNGEVRIGYANSDPVSGDQAHSIGDANLDTVTSNLARLVMQERSGNWISFKDGSGNHYGTISRNPPGVTYGSNSDYRLKENVENFTNGITLVKQLRPVTFNWNELSGFDSTLTQRGFLAHEVQDVEPNAVVGDKDEMDRYGDCYDAEGRKTQVNVFEHQAKEGETWTFQSEHIRHQQLDPAKLVPILTAALQEAIAKIETLETKVAALEAA